MNQGLAYEQRVVVTLRGLEKKLDDFKVDADETAGFDPHSPDITIHYKQQPYHIEVKANAAAQMGGTSFSYDLESKKFAKVKPEGLDDDLFEAVTDYASSNGYYEFASTFVNFVKTQEPVEYHSDITGFPLSCSRDAWTSAKKEKHLEPLNFKIATNTDFILDHYAKKNIHYMQIGERGLFHLRENPLNLPVPQLTGNINVEFRPGRSGSRFHKAYEVRVVGSGLRLQGRLKFDSMSSYTLDNESSAHQLFSGLNETL